MLKTSKFNDALARFLLDSSVNVLVLDEPSIIDEVGNYDARYYAICEGVNRVFVEFDASKVSERTLVNSFAAAMGNSLERRQQTDSSYRYLCDLMDASARGIISIKDAHRLSHQAVHILARLANYARSKKLRWQIILMADTLEFDDLSLAQFSADHTYPDLREDNARATNVSAQIQQRRSNADQLKSTAKNNKPVRRSSPEPFLLSKKASDQNHTAGNNNAANKRTKTVQINNAEGEILAQTLRFTLGATASLLVLAIGLVKLNII